jgi:hypothetical protein
VTETFTKLQFEETLPKHNRTGANLWQTRGLEKGEFTYFLPVSDHAGVIIRSSIRESGVSAKVGEDSIRLWLIDPKTQQPVGSKLSKYITRTRNWQERLIKQLRSLYTLGKLVRPCGCGEGTIKIQKVKKDGENKGKLFSSCSNRTCRVTRFQWVEK